MIVKLNVAEKNTLAAMDYTGKGPKNWIKAREVASRLFRKKEKLLTQSEIRVVRNAFRRLARENIIDKGEGDKRGMYRVTDKGRKMRGQGQFEFDSMYSRGEISAEKSQTVKKPKSKRKAPAKSARSKGKKAVPKKTRKSKSSKSSVVRKPQAPFTVEDKSRSAKARIKGDNGHSKGDRPRRKFKRRAPAVYGDSSNN